MNKFIIVTDIRDHTRVAISIDDIKRIYENNLSDPNGRTAAIVLNDINLEVDERFDEIIGKLNGIGVAW